MTTPRPETTAGRAFFEALVEDLDDQGGIGVYDAAIRYRGRLAAIEAEAVAAERERIRLAVEGLRLMPRDSIPASAVTDYVVAVLAIIDGAS